MISIHNPPVETYFIAFDENDVVLGYGSVLPSQTMDSGADEVYQYTDRAEYLERLAAHGIDPDA